MGNACCAEAVAAAPVEKVEAAEAVLLPPAVEATPAAEAKPAEEQGGGLLSGLAAAVTEAVAEVQEKVAEAAQAVAEVAGTADVKAPEVPPAAAEEKKVETAEPVAATMDAATAAAQHSLIVEFRQGKEQKKVEFKTRALDFQIGAQAGCCGPKARAQVVVVKVDAKKAAEQLGVRRGWVVTHVNGVEVTGLEQGRKLLDEAAARLPQAA